MTREEAEREARRLSEEHPERETHRWVAREEDGGSWAVARIKLPPGMRVQPLGTTTESKPRPPQADDPRSSMDRNVGGPYGPG